MQLARSFARCQDRWRVLFVAAQFREHYFVVLHFQGLADKNWAPAKTKISRHPLYCFFLRSLRESLRDHFVVDFCSRPVPIYFVPPGADVATYAVCVVENATFFGVFAGVLHSNSFSRRCSTSFFRSSTPERSCMWSIW